ncbi:hypothetical protein KAR91_36300 [Candidatus Pacearchaeota archaeon]|nr:hypothetical protein [Candidatus Pacearchaeota archaeon]
MANGERKITRDQGFRMTLTAVLSYLPLIPIFWFLVKPILIEAVSAAVADDIQAQVKEGVRPMNSAFKILLQQQIDTKKREIAAFEDKRQFRSSAWTSKDAEDLVDCKIELEALVAARKEL